MSSPAVMHITCLQDGDDPRGRITRRVFDAAAALLDESSDAEVSISGLATQARVAPAALLAQFPSLDAMFAELYLDRIVTLPLTVDTAAPIQCRVSEQLRAITLVVADEPRLAVACSRALLRDEDAAVADVRSRIAAEVQRRIAAALGAGAWPEVHATLEAVFWGALLQVQTRAVSYRQMADKLDTMVALILPGDDY